MAHSDVPFAVQQASSILRLYREDEGGVIPLVVLFQHTVFQQYLHESEDLGLCPGNIGSEACGAEVHELVVVVARSSVVVPVVAGAPVGVGSTTAVAIADACAGGSVAAGPSSVDVAVGDTVPSGLVAGGGIVPRTFSAAWPVAVEVGGFVAPFGSTCPAFPGAGVAPVEPGVVVVHSEVSGLAVGDDVAFPGVVAGHSIVPFGPASAVFDESVHPISVAEQCRPGGVVVPCSCRQCVPVVVPTGQSACG
ncbi:hypothetical protein CBR_g63121 [Chara braunii]|uniref:Uncharacterized protein n=1 Tax=Chara braunii TaxID=69332 RepID=A0A388K900_CHABU|nr:hypothetical protein CBR_g63121 [Chara braunii]|eukprot:GBG66538.1 hypothetical protein CBR_g63121 [Chara braunii]